MLSKTSSIVVLSLATILYATIAAAGLLAGLRAGVAANPQLVQHMEAQVLSGASLAQTETKARQGDARAEFDLGRSYINAAILHQKGAHKNVALAVTWYRRAARLGYAPAETHLASLYISGLGVPRSNLQGLKWLRLATAQKYARAEGLLGDLYLLGQGVPMNPKKGLYWTHLAAEQRDTSAEMSLGLAYFSGRYVPKDYVKAARWFLLAKEDGAKMGIDSSPLTMMLAAAEAHLSPTQIAQAKHQAQTWSATHHAPKAP
ncbi:MAG: tetratricopeptide repeat protein [Acidiferrobacter sp.]